MVARASQSLGGFQFPNTKFQKSISRQKAHSLLSLAYFLLALLLSSSSPPPPPIPSHLIILREGKKGSFDSQPHSQRGLKCEEGMSFIMSTELETTGKHQVEVHFVNVGVPCLIEENFEGYYLEYGDAGPQDLLQDQETVYQSLHANSGNEITKASASTGSSPDTKQSGGNRKMENEGESSQGDAVESQLALDEAVARALQELELAGSSFSESTGTASDKDDPSSARQESTPTQDSTVNREHNSADTNSVVRQDGIDPDNMTYEELQSLGEAIGTQSKGLSDELISYLPSSKYKTGFFSRKEKHEECVICCMAYKNREILITLPCQHQYHSKCITEWLRINKACPVCTVEVFGS